MKRSEGDFGFSISFHTESDLKAQEEALTQQLAITETDYQKRLEAMRAAIMPLLNNLLSDPEKEWLRWPNRAAQVREFIAKIKAI